MAHTHVALVRGINVGTERRVAMADLRALVAELGYTDVHTLLNSGNVVFGAPGVAPADAAARVEEALAQRLRVPAKVIVLTTAELAEAVAENPLAEIADSPSRLLVGFLADPSQRSRLEPLRQQDWTPEALAIGARAAYLWCPAGMVASPLAQAVGRVLGEGVTLRSWTTVLRIQALIAQER